MPKRRTLVFPVSKGCSRFSFEQSDCTVRALANATDLPYDECHDLLKSFGRIDGSTMDHQKMIQAYYSVGCTLVAAFGTTLDAQWVAAYHNVKCKEGITVARLLKYLHTGRYIVSVRKHVFAVVDGDVIDDQAISGAQSVTALYKVNEC